ncbi:MAG: hypothetical protein QY326_01735 [Bdellovibrionota bacterium]|nr:MAG: hypothetical protein QY326_01735 [Bdellovibrionota bacterium]
MIKTPGIFVAGVLCFAVCLCTPGSALAEGHFSPSAEPSSDELAKVVSAIVRDQIIRPLALPLPSSVDVEGVWQGNIPKARLTVPQVLLHFRKDSEPFTLELNESEGVFVLKHSRPALRSEAGGVRLSLAKPRPKRYFLEGSDGQSLAVWYGDPRSSDLMAVLLCPRKLQAPRYEGDRFRLVPYALEFDGAQFTVGGDASGYLLTGREPGSAEVQLRTTTNVSPSTMYRDAVTSKDPKVAVRYIPRVESISTQPLANEGGIQAYFDLSLASGRRRESYIEQMYWVRPVELKDKVEFIARNRKALLEAGPCYLGIRQRSEWQIFHSEDVPEPP